MELAAVGGSIAVVRDYFSSRRLDAGVGLGWTISIGSRLFYATYLFSAPSTYVKEANVTMPDGRRYRFTENGNGSFSAPLGRYDVLVKNGDGTWDLTLQRSRSVYHYAATGELLTTTDDYGNAQTYTYDGNGRLERIGDSAGSSRYIDIYYGADGRISTLRDSSNREVGYTYNGNGTLATVTDPEGHVTTYSYVSGQYGQMLTRITDHWGRIIADVTYETGKVKTYSENGETYTYTYVYQNDPTKVAKADSLGTSTFVLADAGFVVDRTLPGGATTHTDYNSDGSPSLVTDPVGTKTAYTYDAAGRVLTVTRDYQGTNPVRFDYVYDATYPNNVATITPKNPTTGVYDSNWQGWQNDYYGAGSNAPGAVHHTYRVENDGTTLDTVATYEYDTHGRVTKQTSATGGQTDYAYYTNGDLYTVTAPANNDAGTRPVTTYGYDGLGRVSSVTDALNNVTSYTYDDLGRVLTVTLPKPSSSSTLTFQTTYDYDHYDSGTGLLFTHVTDPNGKLTKLGYDQFGRLGKSIDAVNNPTVYAYSHGHLDSITDANNNVTSYQYNVQRRLSATTFPNGAVESYTYWNDGLLKTKTDRHSPTQTITYGYDGHKRPVTKTNPTGGGAMTYTYTGQKLTSVVDSTVSPSETHSFTYDSSFRLWTNTQATRGSLTYTYDAGDHVLTQAITNGPAATSTYYADGNLNTLTWTPVVGQFKYTYKVTGQYQTLTFPNGQTRGYTYDDQGRVTQVANNYGLGTLATYGYGYDYDSGGLPTLLSQRTSLTTTLPAQSLTGVVSQFGYDGLYQLTGATYPPGAPFNGEVDGFSYDNIGNRATLTVNGTPTAYTYFKNGTNPLNGQRLQNDGTFTYGYDGNGNATTKTGGTSFTLGYTVDNRMSSISGGASASYAYDYQGRRSAKTAGASPTYLYDGQNLVAQTVGGASQYFLFGPGIDEPLATYDGESVYYFDVDALGSVVATNDAAGNITHSVVFDAWGNERATTGTRNHPFSYTGREVGEAGLLYYRARYYDPTIGRFTQEDPAGFAGRQMSFFAYAAGNPVGNTDPLGLEFRNNGKTPVVIKPERGPHGQLPPGWCYGGGVDGVSLDGGASWWKLPWPNWMPPFWPTPDWEIPPGGGPPECRSVACMTPPCKRQFFPRGGPPDDSWPPPIGPLPLAGAPCK